MLPRLRRIVTLRGSAKKHLTVAESDAAHQLSFRRAIYPARDIAAGEVFSEDNLTVLRPAHGLAADRFDEIVGKVARRALKAHEALREEDVG